MWLHRRVLAVNSDLAGGLPPRFALVEISGPARRQSFADCSCAVTLTAILPSMSTSHGGESARAGNIQVNGPGHEAQISARSGVLRLTNASSCSIHQPITMNLWVVPRDLRRATRSQAALSNALAAIPNTASVACATMPPCRNTIAALEICQSKRLRSFRQDLLVTKSMIYQTFNTRIRLSCVA